MTSTDWQETTLADIAYINPIEKLPQGTVAKKIAMDLLSPFTKKITGFALEKYKGGMKFRNGDTLIARITPCLENGKTAYVDLLEEDEVGFGSTEFIVLREKPEKSCKQFLYYFAISPDFRDVAMLSMTGSSGRQRVQSKVVEEHLFLLPPLPEQRAIADVLSSLDAKIDLLHRQNQTLEALAETLFRQWFIEEANPDWEMVKLGEVIETTSGGTPSRNKPEFYENGTYPWVKSKELNGSLLLDTDEKITEDALKKSSAKLLPKHSILLAMYGATVAEYTLIMKPMTCNQAICALLPNESYPYTFIFFYIKSLKDEIKGMAVGSAQQNISQVLIKQLDIISPSNRILQFHQQVESYFTKMKENQQQIQTLERLRDALLPKLMAGSVRVGDLSPTLSLKGEGAEEETKNPLPSGRGQGEGIL
ncbi:MAG: restriction endonuclease subunit S [Vampirovibrio sp.]|nr:restriction endonuclease subunit S [Vampirovibrio sp.]